jgi:citronellol/citronellal dehydrogenase
MISPPLDLSPRWFGPHVAYTTAKYQMSLIALGLAEEFKGKVAVNALWPRTTIATAAIRNLLGGDEMMARSRSPAIMADAAHAILTSPTSFSGNFLIDDTFLASTGVSDFSGYRIDPARDLAPDFFVPDEPPAPESFKART